MVYYTPPCSQPLLRIIIFLKVLLLLLLLRPRRLRSKYNRRWSISSIHNSSRSSSSSSSSRSSHSDSSRGDRTYETLPLVHFDHSTCSESNVRRLKRRHLAPVYEFYIRCEVCRNTIPKPPCTATATNVATSAAHAAHAAHATCAAHAARVACVACVACLAHVVSFSAAYIACADCRKAKHRRREDHLR